MSGLTPIERRDAVAAELNRHRIHKTNHTPTRTAYECACGDKWVTDDLLDPAPRIAEHIADALMPLIEEWLAGAWRGGYGNGYMDGERSVNGWGLASHAEPEYDENPYRRTP